MAKVSRSRVARMAGFAALLLFIRVDSARAEDPIQILRQLPMPDGTTVLIGFDHTRGKAFRVVIDENSGKNFQQQTYPGRPQSSRREFEKAVSIIGRNSTLAGLIAEGAVAEGGFIVDGPAGHPPNNRYIQIRLLSPDRQTLLRVALVDLTEGVVASARGYFE